MKDKIMEEKGYKEAYIHMGTNDMENLVITMEGRENGEKLYYSLNKDEVVKFIGGLAKFLKDS